MIAENLVVERGVSAGDAWITVEPENIKAALQSLKDDGYRLLVFRDDLINAKVVLSRGALD